MKAYTLRIREEVLTALKHLGLKERKTVREILLELIERKLSSSMSKSESLKEQQNIEKVVCLLKRFPPNKVVQSIREDRDA